MNEVLPTIASTIAIMITTYHGSCHCGAVRFEADIDLALASLRCNCSICRKMRFWAMLVAPASFRLLAGTQYLDSYQFGRRVDQHLFCRQCGIHPFGTGDAPRRGPFYAVNLGCLDDVSDALLASVPITYVDGWHDRWDAAPAHTAHL